MRSIWVVEQCGCEAYMSLMAHQKRKTPKGVFFVLFAIPTGGLGIKASSRRDFRLKIILNDFFNAETNGAPAIK